ncbi:EcsC family protein [uncultured Lentibacter sp.]|uniref:EcsC family protein n=1 Tax=uncultured Lentibacter sp. TaxID=1659309 RepID=UPI0026061662|nr:EcsC family protein [uncultured Lentibacter sp.]
MSNGVEILGAPLPEAEVEAELGALARRYGRAGGRVIALLNQLGGQADGLLARLPEPVRRGLEAQTARALEVALAAASRSHESVAAEPAWMTRTLTTAMGAAGGFGGLPSALAELPVTTTVLLRAIQSIAKDHGFDTREAAVKYDCLTVFAVAGPLEKDDGADLAFLSTRLLLNGAAVSGLIARIAPRLSVVLGQKLAAQTVPVLGAAAGAATNYAYTSYYQEMAHVHFGLRRLAIKADLSEEDLLARFRKRLKRV